MQQNTPSRTVSFSTLVHALTTSSLESWERFAVVTLVGRYSPDPDGLFGLSATTLAAEVGVAVKTVRAFLDRLEREGVLRFQERSRGGRAPGGAGHIHRVQLDRARLFALIGMEFAAKADASQAKPATGAEAASAGLAGGGGEAAGSGDLGLAPPPSANLAPGDRPHGNPCVANPVGDGKSVGVRGCLRASESEPIHSDPTTTTSPDSGVVVAEEFGRAEEAMIQFGVTACRAAELARVHPLEAVQRGIRYVRAAKSARNAVGLFISMLANGDFAKAPSPAPSPTIGARFRPPSRMDMWQKLANRSLRIPVRLREEACQLLAFIDSRWKDRLPTPDEISDDLLERAFEGSIEALRRMAAIGGGAAAAA